MCCPETNAHYILNQGAKINSPVGMARDLASGIEMPAIDEFAKEIAVRKFALPPCLHIPIAARNVAAIQKYVGEIGATLASDGSNKALLVEPYDPPAMNVRLPIWRLREAAVLHCSRQVWVHADYSNYRAAYRKAFADQDLARLVLDHVMNRRVARLKDFPYLRIVPVTRAANSSSGGLSEKWAYDYHSTPEMVERNRANPAKIQYADLADIVKMLNLKTGGALQDPVNEARWLIKEE